METNVYRNQFQIDEGSAGSHLGSKQVTIFQPGPFGGNEPTNGTVSPEVHTTLRLIRGTPAPL
jgi:hypothetical protein